MNKKVLIKIITGVLICLCFIVTRNHMPRLMGAVYNAVLGEFDHIALFFVLGVFLLEIIILRLWGSDRRCKYLCLEISIITAVFVLFRGSTYYGERLAPGADTSLIKRSLTDATIEEDDVQSIFTEYFFADKNLILSDEKVKGEEKYQYIYKMAVPSKNIIVDEVTAISDKEAEKILSYPYHEYDSDYFVLDDDWENTENIRMMAWGDKYIFCSEELFERVLDSSNGGEKSSTDIYELAENRPYREMKQVVVMLMLLLVGCAISLPLWGEKYPYLSYFLSLPVGVAVWCMCGIVFLILNIPYNLFSMLGCIILFVGVWLFKRRVILKSLDWQTFLDFIIPAVVVVVFFAYYKVCNTGSDSLMKCAYGYRLARFGTVGDILEGVAPYGMLEPIIMSIGYLVNCDALYVFYPLMGICGIGIMVSGFYYFNDNRDNYISSAILCTGILLLFTNFDYVFSMFLMAAHGPTAVYTLILIMFIVMKKRIDISGFECITAAAAAMIILTRVEGAVYVLFFLAVSLGIESETLEMRWLNILVAGIILVWNVFQMVAIGTNGDSMFWTPERGIILISGGGLLLMMTWLMNRPWVLVCFVKRYYFPLVICGVCMGIVVVVTLWTREIASINLQFFLSHFSNNERMNARINAGGFWTFILLLCPIIMNTKSRLAQYSVTIIGGFLLLIYFVCLFRPDVPLHYGYFDSARRTIVQIMPTAVWLLAYSVGIEREMIN